MDALERVKQWQPTRLDIVQRKANIIKWIFLNVHEFKTLKETFSTAKSSVWKGLVNELFPSSVGKNAAGLIRYFGNASKSPHFFGSFVDAVVKLHRIHCDQCSFQ